MTRKLEDSLRDQKQQNEQANQKFQGMLGAPIGGARTVEVPNRNSYVYVRLRDSLSEIIQAFNNKVSPAYNLPVLVERQGNRYVIVDVDTSRYDNNHSSFSPYLPRHGNTHSFDIESGGGGDIVWVYPRQFMPLLAFPSGSAGSPNVIVSPYTLRKDNGTWQYVGNTGTSNFTPYNPPNSGTAVMGLIALDTTSGNPYLLIGSGTTFSDTLTGTSQVYPYIPALTNPAHIPIAAVRLVSGTSRLTWDNIYDVRQFVHPIATGSAGSAPANPPITGSVVIQDEGVIQGSALTLNFVGDPVSVGVAGGVATVTISATASGSSSSPQFTGTGNSVVLTSPSGTLTTKPWLKYDNTEEAVDFGSDAVKMSQAGYVRYNKSENYFDVFGAGTGTPRRVRMFEDLYVTNDLHVTFDANLNAVQANTMNLPSGITYNAGGVPHSHSATFSDAEGEASSVGTGSADGTSSYPARRDHVHQGSSVMIYPTHALSDTVNASSTEYLCPFIDGSFGTERAMVVLRAGIVKNFFIRQTGNQPASGDLLCYVRKNVATDGISILIPGGTSGAQTHSNTSTSFAVAQGDFVGFKFENQALAASTAIGFVAVEFIADP